VPRDTKIDNTSTHESGKHLEQANDEAAKVLNTYDGSPDWTDAEERKLRRKLDWKLMPVLCLTYGLQYYDKAMLSQAALFGLIPDLDLRGQRYSYAASIFYLGFIAGAYPATILAQRYPIERVASAIITLWGICLILTTTCTGYRGLYAQRFFLGMLESGISPMFMLIVGSFYKKNEQAFRMGIWYSLTGYFSIVSPLINYGWGHVNGSLSQWHYMYFFAGGITILWGIILLFVLPPDPIRAKGFDVRERYILVARLRSNNSGVRNKKYKMSQVVELLTDLKFWLLFLMALLSMVSNGAISTFAPLVIRGFGFSTLNTLLLYMPAGAYAGTMMVLLSFLAMKFKNIRTWLIFGGQMGTTLAAALLYGLPLDETGGLLFAVYILPSTGAAYGVLMGLPIANTAGYTKRALASSGLYIGYCLVGNFIGPLVFLEREAPQYPTGFIVTLITAVISGFLALAYRMVCILDNRKRDKAGFIEGFDHAFEDPTDKENKQFRYIL
ncbi:putative transporter, partial [Pseudocercospora fuligena]